MSDLSLMQSDLCELLTVLDAGNHARANSPHEVMQEAIAILRTKLAAKTIPDGFVLVPVAATKTMIDAAYAAHDAYEASEGPGAWCGLYSVYEAMIAAAPHQIPSDDKPTGLSR